MSGHRFVALANGVAPETADRRTAPPRALQAVGNHQACRVPLNCRGTVITAQIVAGSALIKPLAVAVSLPPCASFSF
jgi:hypothetical protein